MLAQCYIDPAVAQFGTTARVGLAHKPDVAALVGEGFRRELWFWGKRGGGQDEGVGNEEGAVSTDRGERINGWLSTGFEGGERGVGG